MEIWKDIKGYEGLYQVSNLGNVKSLNYRNKGESRLLKLGILPIGYPVVVLSKNGKHATKYVHRLVADAFIPNHDNKPLINHIDGCKTNNAVVNLEWVTARENVTHAHINGLADVSKAWRASVEKSRIPVVQMDMDGNVICEFSSSAKAGKAVHAGHSTILECARGLRDSAGGYKWRFSDGI